MFRRRRINSFRVSQVFPNNKLEREVQSIVCPLNFALHLFLSSKYRIRNNNIYPHGNKFYFLAFFCTLFLSSLSIQRLRKIYFLQLNLDKNHLSNNFAVFLAFIFFISYSIGFIMMFILDIVHKHNNVSLILKIQTIHRGINSSDSIRSFVIWNWISLMFAIFFDSLFCILHYVSSNDASNYGTDLPDLLCDYMFITFDVNLMVAIRIIILLRKYLGEWIKEVLTINEEEEDDEQHCLLLLEKHQNILEAYNLYKTIFQALVLFQLLQAFFRSIAVCDLCFTAVIALRESKQMLTKSTVLFFISVMTAYIVRSITIVIIHSVSCENFYTTVLEAKITCIQLMKNRNCSNTQKQFCKSVIQATRSFSKMTACGLFCVDSGLAISLIRGIMNYGIVLLQIFFL